MSFIYPADDLFEDPASFDFNSQETSGSLLDKLITNPDFNKLCDWEAGRALEDGVDFKNDKNMEYQDPLLGSMNFDTFLEYVIHLGAWQHVRDAISFSRLLGEAVIFFRSDAYPPKTWKQSENPYYKEIIFDVNAPMTETMVFHPFDGNNGYQIVKQDPITLIPEIFKFTITDLTQNHTEEMQDRSSKYLYVHATNCVFFSEPRKRGGMRGTPKSYLIHKIAHAKEIMIKAVLRTMLKLAGGVAVMKASSDKDAAEQDSHLKALSYIDRVYCTQDTDIEQAIQFLVPDIKIDQLSSLVLMVKKELASGMGISLRSLGEEDIAAGMGEGGAKFSNLLQKAEIKDIQTHYKRPIMSLFYLLGQETPSFEWSMAEEELMAYALDENMQEDEQNDQRPNEPGPQEGGRPAQEGGAN